MKPTKVRFDKPPTTFDEQLDLLESRGLVVADRGHALHALWRLNYYRLRAYWIPFEERGPVHKFVPGATFDDVLRLYEFDRQLRLIVMDAIERIEVAVRTQWAYHIAHEGRSHLQLGADLALDSWQWTRNLQPVCTAVERSQETFILHFREKYVEGPPVWAVCEVMSLGDVSRLYKSLGESPLAKRIAEQFGLSPKLMHSWLHHLTLVRNICAHHGRLWNRDIAVAMATPRSLVPQVAAQWQPSRKPFNTLLVCLYFTESLSLALEWRERLLVHLRRRADLLPDMGFPIAWERGVLWTAPTTPTI